MTPDAAQIRPNPDAVQRQAADPQSSVWVSASAGSGKTKVLTDRVLALLVDGARPDSLLCVTFTKAAAAEMANRIHHSLAKWTRLPDSELNLEIRKLDGRPPTPERLKKARELFAEILDLPGGLRIRTIHSFCQSVLGRFPLEAGLPPNFTAMDEREASDAMVLARDTVLAAAQRDDALGDALSIVVSRVNEEGFGQLMRALSAQRGALAAAIRSLGGQDAAIARLYGILSAEPGIDESDVLTDACIGADEIGLRTAVAAMNEFGSDANRKRARVIDAWLAGGVGTRAATFEQYFSAFITGKGTPNTQMFVKAVAENSPATPDILAAEQDRLIAVDRRLRRQVTATASAALLRLGGAILKAYDLRKRATASLDYDDLIQRTAELLTAERVPWVLFKLDGGLSHMLIDEAQDTSPDQRAIVDALVAEFFAGAGGHEERRTVFVVGDAKQSIYSFQGADPVGYRAWRDELSARANAMGGPGMREVPMQVSFRSVQAVLDAVDATFAESPAADGVVEPGDTLAHFASEAKEGLRGRVELWPPTEPPAQVDADLFTLPAEADAAAEADATQRLAEGLARTVAGWIGREALPSEGRTVRPGDILFLMRSRSDLVHALVRELTRLGVPVAGVDRLMLTDDIAIMDLVALGRVLLMPDDDLTLACVLKSPLIGFGEDDLFRLATTRGEGAPLWRRLRENPDGDDAVARAFGWISDLMALADRLPPFELYQRALVSPCPGPGGDGAASTVHTGRQAMVARLGPEAEDPINEFLNLALDYDRRQVPSLEGFLAWFERDSTELKRDLESEARDEIRIMTAHGAKGLQAPIVILPDAFKKSGDRGAALRWYGLHNQGPGDGALPIWTPRARFEEDIAQSLKADLATADDQEYRRLLYVAMTRAESRLIVTGRLPRTAPPKGNWSELVQAGFERLSERNPDSVREEEIAPADGWTGFAKIYETGNRDAAKDGKGPDRSAGPQTGDAPDWLTRTPPGEPTPPAPLAPSRPSRSDPPARSPIRSGEPVRFQRGLLIHRLLQTLPDMTADRWQGAADRYLALPGHGLSAEERQEIAREVLGVLNHPEFRAIFGPGSRAEVPLTGLLERRGAAPEGESGRVFAVSGQVDRLLISEKEILVVDYKTLRPSPTDEADIPDAYVAQMAGYRGILRQIYPDRRIRCGLLFTETPHLVAIPDAAMDSFS